MLSRVRLSLPIDGSCDGELSVKGLSSEELTIGNWHEDLLASESEISVSGEGKTAEIPPDKDENAGGFFIELDGAVLQVGGVKKKKLEQTRAGVKAHRHITCSACHQQGHNKRSQNCPVKSIEAP